MTDITVKRGDTFKRRIILKDNSGNPIDATGWTIWFTVRKYIVSSNIKSDSEALISQNFEGTSDGIIIFTISSEDMDLEVGTFYYDIQIKNSNGIISSDIGKFIVTADITRDR